MKRLFLACILGIPGIVSAQTVNFKFTLDDPSQVRNLSLAPFYYGFNFGIKATPVGFALFYTGHHISAETNYEIGGTNTDTSMANIKQYHEFGLNVAVNFSDKTEPVTQKVTLSHSSDGTYRYEKYFEVDATARKIKRQ